MAAKWVKAAFLFVVGIILTLYGEKFVDELKESFADQVAFDEVWSLLTILIWVLVAWLFVDGALVIVLSFSEQRYTLGDVMKRLDVIEKKLGIRGTEKDTSDGEDLERETEADREEPPPPRE